MRLLGGQLVSTIRLLLCRTLPAQSRPVFHFTRVLIKSLAQPASRCILFDGENISFDASLVRYIYIYINSTNIRTPIVLQL